MLLLSVDPDDEEKVFIIVSPTNVFDEISPV